MFESPGEFSVEAIIGAPMSPEAKLQSDGTRRYGTAAVKFRIVCMDVLGRLQEAGVEEAAAVTEQLCETEEECSRDAIDIVAARFAEAAHKTIDDERAATLRSQASLALVVSSMAIVQHISPDPLKDMMVSIARDEIRMAEVDHHTRLVLEDHLKKILDAENGE